MSKEKMYFTLLFLIMSLLGPLPGKAAIVQRQIVIEAKNEPLASVLKRLEKLTSYKMMYANDDVFGLKVTRMVRAADVSKALEEVLQGTGLVYSIDRQFVTIRKAPLEKATVGIGDAFIVNGHVYDESGLDMPGVAVLILGTDKGTTTDVDGRFSLKVHAGEKLRFSFLGYRESVETVKASNNRKPMRVTLNPDSKSIDEVQVVAFGTQKKESVVASITTVKPGDLKTSSSDLTTAFAGKDTWHDCMADGWIAGCAE